MVRVLRRVGIPRVVVVVDRLLGVRHVTGSRYFASEKHLPDADSQAADSELFHPKPVIYEVLGPVSAVPDISYFDSDPEPRIDQHKRASNDVNAYKHCLDKGK